MNEIEHTTIETNGIRLHVAQAGPTSGPLVLLLHGFPEYWAAWRGQIGPLVAAGCRVLAPDLRGYNQSDKPAGVAAYDLDTLVLDVRGLIQAAGREKAHIVGHDWGAAVAWQLATLHAGWVDKLVIMNVPHPAVMINTLRSSLVQMRKSWYMFYFQIPFLPEWSLSRNNYAALAATLRHTSRRGTFTQEALVGYREAWSQPGALTAMLNWYRSLVRKSVKRILQPRQLPRITTPTLMLWGVQDTALDSSMAQPSIDLCETGELIFFEQATHWVQHEEVEQVNAHLLRFLITCG